MPIDLVGDGGTSHVGEIRSFEHWWDELQVQCSPHRAPGRALAKIAWNAAIERAARECAMMQLMSSGVDYSRVCRQFQVEEGR